MAGPGTFPTRDGSRRGPRLEPAHSMNIVLSEDRVIGFLPGRPDPETATFHEGHHRSSVDATGPFYSTQDLGSFGVGKLNRAQRDRHGADHGDDHSGQRLEQSRPGQIGRPRRRGTVEDCAKVIEFLATDLSGDVTGAAIPIDGGLVRGIVSHPPFPWRFVSSSIVEAGIELFCNTRVLPMPVKAKWRSLLTAEQRLFGIHATGYTEPHGKDRKTAEIMGFWEVGVTSRPLHRRVGEL
jgi:hypothetical protein